MTTGLALLATAVTEAQCAGQGNQAFARQLYVHALAYLLRGLPADLTEAEAASLQPAIPPCLRAKHGPTGHQEPPDTETQRGSPSLLHRLLASGIVQLFLIFSFVVPHVKFFLHSAYKYDRTHHISERLLTASLDTMGQMGRKGFGVALTLVNSGNGRVGSILTGAFAWWIEGVSGGIHDGVGEIMALVNVRGGSMD